MKEREFLKAAGVALFRCHSSGVTTHRMIRCLLMAARSEKGVTNRDLESRLKMPEGTPRAILWRFAKKGLVYRDNPGAGPTRVRFQITAQGLSTLFAELAGVERDFFAEAFDLLLADLDEVGLSTALRSLILFLCLDGEDQARNVKELEYFLRIDRNVIRPALKVAMKEGLIIHLDEGAPRGTARRYQLTEKGRDLLGRHCVKGGPVLL